MISRRRSAPHHNRVLTSSTGEVFAWAPRPIASTLPMRKGYGIDKKRAWRGYRALDLARECAGLVAASLGYLYQEDLLQLDATMALYNA